MRSVYALLLSLAAGLLAPGAAWCLSFHFTPGGGDLVGELRTVRAAHEDTFSDLARIYDLGYEELRAANPGVDPWLPGEGTQVTLPMRFILPPGPREGIVINLPELRLYYYPKDERRVITYPLGIGREGWSTPTGETVVTGKRPDPPWRPPASIRAEHAARGESLPEVVPPGPDNPLGQHAVYFAMAGYLLHGTNKPYGVGMRVSHGCIRLYPEDIAELFEQLPVGTPVRIIDEPYKAGWSGGRLYVEVHPPLSETQHAAGASLAPMESALTRVLGEGDPPPDWNRVHAAVAAQRGFPVAVGGGAGKDTAGDLNLF